MKPRIIFCDVDGTLVGRDLVVSPQIIAAVREWIQQGNLFSLASGRQFAGAFENACNILGLTSPQVTMNGGQIIDVKSRGILQAEYIDPKDLSDILDYLEKTDMFYWIEKNNAVYTPTGESKIETFGNVPFYPISQLEVHNISKGGMNPNSEKDDKKIHEDLVLRYPNTHFVRLSSPFGINWDMTAKGATKHTGVLKVIKMLGMSREQTIAIGDGMNDFPLLEACSYKVAMGNAVEDLKSIADYVTTPFSEDGVAKAIYHLLENK